MKYFYIHYKAIGNSIMMCVSLRKHIMNNGYDWEDVEVHNDSQSKRLEALQMGANILHYVFNGEN